MRKTFSAQLLAGAVLLAGCGGGEDFETEADRVCKPRVDFAAKQEANPTGDLNAWVEVYDKELYELREVEPPEGKEQEVRRLLDLYAERNRRMREIARLQPQVDAVPPNPRRLQLVRRLDAALTAEERARVRGNQLALELGLEACGKILT